jgi:hypothetical protein
VGKGPAKPARDRAIRDSRRRSRLIAPQKKRFGLLGYVPRAASLSLGRRDGQRGGRRGAVVLSVTRNFTVYVRCLTFRPEQVGPVGAGRRSRLDERSVLRIEGSIGSMTERSAIRRRRPAATTTRVRSGRSSPTTCSRAPSSRTNLSHNLQNAKGLRGLEPRGTTCRGKSHRRTPTSRPGRVSACQAASKSAPLSGVEKWDLVD